MIVGHDWGAPVAWHSALLRPDRFRAVIGLSVPYRPRGPVRPTTVMPQTDAAMFYQLYFQTPGVAEAELERDPGRILRMLLWRLRRRGARHGRQADAGPGMAIARPAFLASGCEPPRTCRRGSRRPTSTSTPPSSPAPAFAAVSTGIATSTATGSCSRPSPARRVTVPALYIAGDRDLVVKFPGIEATRSPTFASIVPQLRRQVMLPGCGHWTQQERASEVNAAMIEFLKSL